jgi:hypothetical protein
MPSELRILYHDPLHVRHVLTALLIQDRRILGSGPRLACRESLRDPDQDVPHRVATAEDQHLVWCGLLVHLGARGVGVHGERLEVRGFPIEGDGPGDGRCGESHSRPHRRPYQPNRQTQRVRRPAHVRLLSHRKHRLPVIYIDAAAFHTGMGRLYTGRRHPGKLLSDLSAPGERAAGTERRIAAPALRQAQGVLSSSKEREPRRWGSGGRRPPGLVRRSRRRAIRRASGRVAVRAPAVASAIPPPPRSTRRWRRTRPNPEPTDGHLRDGASA